MTKSALAKLAILGVFSATACSLFVDADRSTVKDDLYQPSVIPEEDAGDAEPGDDAGDAEPGDDAGDAEPGDDAGEEAGAAAGAGGAAGAGSAGATGEGGSGG